MKGTLLPLKFTTQVDIVKTFGQYISKQAGHEAFVNTEATFKDMQSIRGSLDFPKMQAQLKNDFKLAAEFEGLIINYARYVYLVENFFSKDFSDPKGIKLQFPWSDSFNPTKKAKVLSHIKYELVSVLYNLAIVYYTEGIYFSSVPQDQDRLKGIAKLRNALWCLNEIKEKLPSILANPSDLPSDVNLTFVTLLINYITGLTYATLIELMMKDTKKNGPEKLASVNKAASKHFQMAYDILRSLKECPLPENEARRLLANLHYNASTHRAEAMYRISLPHLDKVDEEILKGHMGFATSYLRIAKAELDFLAQKKGDIEFLTPEQAEEVLKQKKIIDTNYDNCALKNAKVYKQTEYKPEQLPEIPDDKTPISPMEPKDIKSKIGCEHKFECFLSPEILALKKEYMDLVAMKGFEVENALKNLHNVKNKLYAEAYVNYLLSLESQAGNKKVELPADLKKKIDKFRQNGGFNTYDMTRKNITEASNNCGTAVNQVKTLLTNEKSEDELIRKSYPSKWNRPYSEQVNQEYVFKLRDLEQKFFIAGNTDKDIFKKYDQYLEWMMRFSQTDDQLLQLIPQSSDAEFVLKNKSQIAEISQLNKQLVDQIDSEKLRNSIRVSYEKCMQNDTIASFVNIFNKQVKKEEEFDKILSTYIKELAVIEKAISEAYPLLDTIVSKAKQVNSTRSESNQSAVKVLEEMNLAIAVINGIYDDFQQGANFYMNLGFHLNTLQKVTSDFCMARDIEKKALLQDIEAENNYNKLNVQKPFFQEQSNTFAQGKSEFIPMNQYPNTNNTLVNQGNVQQQQYQQTMPQPNQTYNPNINYGQQQQQQNYSQQQNFNNQQYQPTQIFTTHPSQNHIQTQIYNPSNTQTQPQNQPNTQNLPNVNANSQMGYMPINDPFGGLAGGLVESTIITNPFGNQPGKK